MGTKNNPGVFDCYAKAEPDEPRFVLLGRDRHAASLVYQWAVKREAAGEDPAVVADARECARQMFVWANKRVDTFRIAILANVDPRTVKRFNRGEPVRRLNADRIKQAILEMKSPRQ